MKIVTYTAHGLIPDSRAFAPALVAQALASNLCFSTNIHVSAREGHPLRQELHPEFGEIHRIEMGRVYRRLFCKLTRLDPLPLHARLAHLCRQLQPDLLHVHQIEFPVADFLRRLGKRIPVVVHAHAVRQYRPEWGTADRYLAVSEFTRQRLVEKGFPETRVEVLHNGTDTGLFAPIDPIRRQGLRLALALPDDAFLVAYVGRKQEGKGYLTYLRTLRRLCDQAPNIFGVAAGPVPEDAVRDPQIGEIRRLAAELTATGRLRDLPPLRHRELANVYRLADVLLFPTRSTAEQHPLVLIEGLAAGCVVITTRTAGIAETVRHGQHALLLDDPDDDAAAASLVDLVRGSLDSYQPMRVAGRELVRRQYDWRILAGHLERLYFSLRAL